MQEEIESFLLKTHQLSEPPVTRSYASKPLCVIIPIEAGASHETPKAEIISLLNEVLKNELTAINQYFLHAKILEDMGYEQLAQKERAESIEEMEHADWLMDRILFLEGLPNLQDLGKLRIGETIPEMFDCDLALEHDAIPALRRAIAVMEEEQDFVTRDLLNKILTNEESHVDWLETQIGLIDGMGLENYLQSQMKPA